MQGRSAKNCTRLRVPVVAALCGLAAHSFAHAQSLDYATLESMFGEPVTVSATGRPERVSDTAVTLEIITAEDIKRSGAHDLMSLLRALPGIDDYRGFNGNQEAAIGSLFLNGREIYLTNFGDIFLPSVPVELDEIRQIEVVRGPQSALYGFNAAQGVINIITYDPARDPIDRVILRAGNDGRRDGGMVLTEKLAETVGLRLTAAAEHARYDLGNAGRLPNPDRENPDRLDLSANLSAYLGNGDHAGLEVSHSDISTTFMTPQFTTLINSRLQTDSAKADYEAESAVGRISFVGFLTAETLPQASTAATAFYALHDHTADVKISDLAKIGRDDSLRIGLDYRWETLHTSNITGALWTSMFAGSAMWDHSFSSDLSIVNALRYYRSESGNRGNMLLSADATDYGLAYESAVIYKPDALDSLRASLSRGVALPTQRDFAQLGLASTIGRPVQLASDANLSRSPSLEYRIGWDRQLPEFEALARASLFTKQSVNALQLLPLQLLAFYQLNCGALCGEQLADAGLSGVFDGAELQIEHKARDGWRWSVNYTAEQLHPHNTAASVAAVPALREDEIFQHLNGAIGYGGGDWAADMRLYYAAPIRCLILQTATLTPALVHHKAIVALAPHIGWAITERLSFDVAADNLWPYRENPLQRRPATYFASLRLDY